MIAKLWGLIPTPYRLLGAALLAVAIFCGGYRVGHAVGENPGLKIEVKTQTKRADNAEEQRDIANAPPASVDDMLDWLSDDDKRRR